MDESRASWHSRRVPESLHGLLVAQHEGRLDDEVEVVLTALDEGVGLARFDDENIPWIKADMGAIDHSHGRSSGHEVDLVHGLVDVRILHSGVGVAERYRNVIRRRPARSGSSSIP